MMSELIKMSLFCDSEMYPEGTGNQQTDERSFYCDQEMTSCQANSDLYRSITRFINAESRVELSSFETVHPDRIFENDYLTAIVETRTPKLVSTPNQPEVTTRPEPIVGINMFKCKAGDVILTRPPYTYRALVLAAIFLSDEKVLRKGDVVKSIKDMFEVFRFENLAWQKRWQRNVQTRKEWQKETIALQSGRYGLNYDTINMKVFEKASQLRKDTEHFADDLFAELGVPEKYYELRYRVEKSRQQTIKKTFNLVTSPAPEVIGNCTTRSAEVTQSPEEPAFMKKSPSWKLPPRPCFSDDSSNDSFQLEVSARQQNDSAHAPSTEFPDYTTSFSPPISHGPTNYNIPFVQVPGFANGQCM